MILSRVMTIIMTIVVINGSKNIDCNFNNNYISNNNISKFNNNNKNRDKNSNDNNNNNESK